MADNADQFSILAKKRAAGVAWVDGGIRLDEILVGIDPKLTASQGADDAACDGLSDTKWVTDGEHQVPNIEGV